MTGRMIGAGAVAGVVAVLAFTVAHQLTISSIWWMAVPMLVVGAMCGAALAASYAAVTDQPTVGGWLALNAAYVGLLTVLTVVSFVLFEPVMSMAEVVNSSGGLPPELARRALPLAAAFAVVSAIVVHTAFRGAWSRFPVTLIASVLVMFLLGMNLAAAGLVDIPTESLYLLGKFLGLVVVLAVVNAAAFLVGARALGVEVSAARATPRPGEPLPKQSG